jgi:hypothetical protein
MDDLKVSHLPVLDQEEYLGLLEDADILDMEDTDAPIGMQIKNFKKVSANIEQHIFDLMRISDTYKLSLIPVLDHGGHYVSSITLPVLLNSFTRIASASNPGGIIVIELNERDYSLSEISGIVESNNAKILSLFIHTYDDSTKMQLTIKLNSRDIKAVLQTFARYKYTIMASFTEKEYDDDLRERYDSLMRYLNV